MGSTFTRKEKPNPIPSRILHKGNLEVKSMPDDDRYSEGQSVFLCDTERRKEARPGGTKNVYQTGAAAERK